MVQLVLQVTVDVVRVLRQHAREDAVQQREHLPVVGPQARGRGLVAVLHVRRVHGHHSRQQQIADGARAVLCGRCLDQRRRRAPIVDAAGR